MNKVTPSKLTATGTATISTSTRSTTHSWTQRATGNHIERVPTRATT